MKKLVKRTLGIKDHSVRKIIDSGYDIHIYLDIIKGNRAICSCCGGRMKVRDRLKERCWRHVPLWNIPVFLHYKPARVNCSICGIKVESIPWSNGKSCISKPLSISIAVWARQIPMDAVRRIFNVCWNVVYSSVKQMVDYGISCHDISDIFILGIDEISRKKEQLSKNKVIMIISRRS